MNTTETNKCVVRAFVDAVNEQDWQKLDLLVSPHFVRHSEAAKPGSVRNRQELKAFLIKEFEVFPDGRESIEDLVAEGDRVAARKQFSGTQRGQLGNFPPSGRRLEASYLAIYRLEDGRIAEAWAEWDNLSGLQQLGHT